MLKRYMLKVQEIKVFTTHPSGIVSYGISGYGKTTQTIRNAVLFYDRGCKVLVMSDHGRFEFSFMSLPNDDAAMLAESPDVEPRGFPLETLFPACPGVPHKVPDCFKPFRIAFNDLWLDEFIILLGRITPTQEAVLRLAWKKKKKKGTFLEFVEILKNFATDTKVKIEGKVLDVCDDRSGLALLQKVDDLYQLCLLCEDDDPFRLDLDAIMRDRKTITTFSFAFLDDENMRHLIMGFLYRKIYMMRLKRFYGRYPELLLTDAEVQDNAPARGKSGSFTKDGQDISTYYLRNIGSKPRDVGIRLNCDSQDPMKIDKDTRNSFQTRFLFRLDRTVVDALGQQFWMPDSVKAGIQGLDRGVCCVQCPADRKHPYNHYGSQYNTRFPAPPCKVKRFDEHFFEAWRKAGRKFTEFKFKQPKSLLTVTRLSKTEKEVTTMRSESLYEFYGRGLFLVIRDSPGLSIKELSDSQWVKDMEMDYRRVCNIIENMLGRDFPVIKRVKKGQSWCLYPV